MYVTPHIDILKTDALGKYIQSVIASENPQTILEIGSSDGRGSTSVIMDAIKDTQCQLYCIEMLASRFDHLVINTSMHDNVHCYNVPSVGTDGMMKREYILEFRKMHPDHTLWKVMTMDEIYKWYDNTVKDIEASSVKEGIQHIKQQHGIDTFDMVLIDGGPFTGLAELKAVYGSKVIIMDDVNDIKCYDAMRMLIMDNDYELLARDLKYRNGFAAFKRIQ